MKSTVIVLFMCLIAPIRSQSNRRTSSKHIQRSVHIDPPNIEALTPKGLRVSLPHIDGMQLFAFHAKINSPIRRTESGNIARDITHPVDGYWTFEDPNIQLRIGDVINYWIFVEINGMGYRMDNLSKIIREIASPYWEENRHSTSESESSSSGGRRTSTTAPRQIDCNCDLSELKTITSQLNVTLMQVNNLNNKLVPMQLQVESLTELLLELIKDQNIGTQLLLVGQEPPGRNPVEAIRQLITEKLELVDLENKIQQAHSTEDGIYFEMSSPVDKKRILFRAGQRLEDSSYQIVDPAFNRAGNRQPYITAAMVRMGGNDRVISHRNREDYQSSSIVENSSSDRNRDRTTVRPSSSSTRRQDQQSSIRREQENLISLSRDNRGTQYTDDDDDDDSSTYSGNRNRQGSRTAASDRSRNSNSRRREQSGYELEGVQTTNERYTATREPLQ